MRPALIIALAVVLAAPAAAVPITIEPDNYTAEIPDVAPGATLSVMRYNSVLKYVLQPVRSVDGGSWTPTGIRVFGHRKATPTETIYHWDGLNVAYNCVILNQCGSNFYVLRMDFDATVGHVQILTTQHGEMAMDPIELWAFNPLNQRILRCQVQGVTPQVLQSGVLPNPKYWDQNNPNLPTCGQIIQKKNCVGPDPGNCDYVVSLNVTRSQKDIKYVWFGGRLSDNSLAPADQLTYWLP